MEAPEASEKRLKTLDTTEHLQSFLEALKEINKISLRHRSNLYKVLEGYEDPDLVLLQYFKLLAATYDRKGTSRGFCSIICSLMLKWTSKEAQQSLDEDELLKTMLEGWNMNGGVSLIPDDLLNALQPEFKTAFFFAADTIIGSTRVKFISSGMKLTKILTAMYAIQVHMHTAASVSEVEVSNAFKPAEGLGMVEGLFIRGKCMQTRWEKLGDVVRVDSLSCFTLPEGWEVTLQQAVEREQDRKSHEHPAESARPMKRKRRSVARQGGTRRKRAQKKADTVSLASDDSGHNDEPEAGTEVSNRHETSGENADEADQAAPAEQEAASGGTAEHRNEGEQEEDVPEAALFLASAFQGEMRKMLDTAARLVARGT